MLSHSDLAGMGITGAILTDMLDKDDLLDRAEKETEFTIGCLAAAATALSVGLPGFTGLLYEAMAGRMRREFYLSEAARRA